MQYDDFNIYLTALSQVEAQEMIIEMQLHDYPNLSKEKKIRHHRKVHRIAYPSIYEHNNCMSAEEVAKKLGAFQGK